jgi:60S ribosome subunit biogenesis protein NIP7
MRTLTAEETKVFFEKLSKYIGRNVKFLIDRSDEEHCFRLSQTRVYYVATSLLNHARSVPAETLVSMGTCFGKFTKSGKFKLVITCLDYLAQYAK